jgi:fluoride exporter
MGHVGHHTVRLALAYVWIALGSAIGGAARYWWYGFMSRHAGETFPWGTLAVNVIGCAFIGFFATFTGSDGRVMVAPAVRQFVMPGICGGFTTFSTFSLETLNLVRDGEWGKAAINVLASLVLCGMGVFMGHNLAAAMNER